MMPSTRTCVRAMCLISLPLWLAGCMASSPGEAPESLAVRDELAPPSFPPAAQQTAEGDEAVVSEPAADSAEPTADSDGPEEAVATAAQQPVEFQIGEGKRVVPVLPEGIDGYAVEAFVSEHLARYVTVDEGAAERLGLVVTDPPKPKVSKSPKSIRYDGDEVGSGPAPTSYDGEDLLGIGISPSEPPSPSAAPFTTTFPSLGFGDNIPNNPPGFVFTPPDSSGAAGPGHVVSVVNTSIQFHTKAGTPLLDSVPGLPVTGVSLASFFAPLVPANATFDPKVIYDQHAGRFVVVTLELVDTGVDLTSTSRILVAVSDDSDPTGTWFFTAIPSKIMIGGIDRWADYPGFAVDEEAVYLSLNMFGFSGGGGGFGGTRLWIIDKFGGAGGGFYGGGTPTVGFFDPVPPGGFAGTMQPAHVFGLPSTSSPNVGTWLTFFNGLTAGFSDFLQIVRVDDPITFGSTAFVGPLFVSMGDIDDLGASLPDAPQFDVLGDGAPSPPRAIETNNRRTLHSVWRNNDLYVTTTIDPETTTPDPDAGDATAHWVHLSTATLGIPALIDQGNISGEDIPDIGMAADSKHTFFPSIAVSPGGDIAIGFSASGSTIHPGSYYTTHLPTSPAGSNTGSTVLSAGVDEYVRTFDSSLDGCDTPSADNRWGDYSGAAIDPVDGCFWIYNQHAGTRGTGTTGGCNGAPDPEDGRWATSFGKACACGGTEALTQSAWKQISMNCNPGAMDTVADVFGDDLTGTYDTNWVVFRRDEATTSYIKLATTDSLVPGEGYWILSNLTGQSVSMAGASNSITDIPLTGVAAVPPAGCASSAGQCNKVGHPHNYDVCWADVLVVDGASTLSLAGADPSGICQTTGGGTCIMSRIAHKYTGAGYAAFDGATPGMEGTLTPWDGLWVSANKPGIELRIPMMPGSGPPCGPPALTEGAAELGPAGPQTPADPAPWFIRLIAESGPLEDRFNVFGQAASSVDGYDAFDLPEIDAFGSNYLTIVFPHFDWGVQAGNYSSDYHSYKNRARRELWNFEVHSSDPAAQVELRWEGPALQLSRSVLVDNQIRRRVRPRPDGSYAFTMSGSSHSFSWYLKSNSGPVTKPRGKVTRGQGRAGR